MEKIYDCCEFLTLLSRACIILCKAPVFTRFANNKQSGKILISRTAAIQILL